VRPTSGRIEQLTSDQEALAGEVREEWLAAGLTTAPAERLRAERGMRAAYIAAGLPPPSAYIWVRSPLEAALGTTHMVLMDQPRARAAKRSHLPEVLGAAYLDLVGRPDGELWGRAWARYVGPDDDPLQRFLNRTFGCGEPRVVRAQVDTQVSASAWRAARMAIGGRVLEDLRTGVGDSVRERVVENLWLPVSAHVQAEVWTCLRLQLEARHARLWSWHRSWAVVRDLYRLLHVQDALLAPTGDRSALDGLAVHDFLARACGLEASARLHGLMEVARSSGWWWPYRSAVVLSERPVHIALDGDGRLHGTSGPAIEYPDGWQVWAWHGVRVPRHVVLQPEALNAREILKEPDVEVRRVMIERLGNDRFVRDAGARRLAEDETGVLWRVDLPFDEPIVCVEVTNATPEADATFRRYMLRVPPTMRSPRQAVAWTFGVDPSEYRPAAQS
jgi:hypothetical protein